jgi:hypothetical protein
MIFQLGPIGLVTYIELICAVSLEDASLFLWPLTTIAAALFFF